MDSVFEPQPEPTSAPVAAVHANFNDSKRLNWLENFIREKGSWGISFDFHKDGNEPCFRIMWKHHHGEPKYTLRGVLDEMLDLSGYVEPEPTAEQIGAVLDFATVAGITNRYAASLRGTAARMSAEAFCRFCVQSEVGPADVLTNIPPENRPSYGDILSAVNWLLLGLAPEAMEYRPLRAVREWALGYMGGSEK